jgi:hypothetical protein
MDYVDNLEELIVCLALNQIRPLLIGVDGRPWRYCRARKLGGTYALEAAVPAQR